MENEKIGTGMIDVKIDRLEILNESLTPPIAINDPKEECKENDDFRLTYRYLDLRRPWIQKNLMLKSRFLKAVYEFFYANGFENIETPVLCKSTPEGARLPGAVPSIRASSMRCRRARSNTSSF